MMNGWPCLKSCTSLQCSVMERLPFAFCRVCVFVPVRIFQLVHLRECARSRICEHSPRADSWTESKIHPPGTEKRQRAARRRSKNTLFLSEKPHQNSGRVHGDVRWKQWRVSSGSGQSERQRVTGLGIMPVRLHICAGCVSVAPAFPPLWLLSALTSSPRHLSSPASLQVPAAGTGFLSLQLIIYQFDCPTSQITFIRNQIWGLYQFFPFWIFTIVLLKVSARDNTWTHCVTFKGI